MNRRPSRTPAVLVGVFLTSLLTCGRSAPPPALVVGERSFSAEYVEAYLDAAGVRGASPERQREALDALVVDELLAQQAVAEGLDQSLARQVTLDQQRRRLLARAYQEHLAAPDEWETAARAAYDADPARYTRRVRALSLIVVYVRERAGRPVGEAEARGKITNAYAALRAGRPFAEVAASFSDDPISRARGGELGDVSPDSLDPALRDLAFTLSTGSHSEPVRLPAGWAIVRADGDPRQITTPFEVARTALVEEARARRVHERVDELRRSHPIRIPTAP